MGESLGGLAGLADRVSDTVIAIQSCLSQQSQARSRAQPYKLKEKVTENKNNKLNSLYLKEVLFVGTSEGLLEFTIPDISRQTPIPHASSKNEGKMLLKKCNQYFQILDRNFVISVDSQSSPQWLKLVDYQKHEEVQSVRLSGQVRAIKLCPDSSGMCMCIFVCMCMCMYTHTPSNHPFNI